MLPSLIFVKLLTQDVEQNYGIDCTEMALGVKLLRHCKICTLFTELIFMAESCFFSTFNGVKLFVIIPPPTPTPPQNLFAVTWV